MSIQHSESTLASAPSAPAAAGFRDPTTLTRWLTILLWFNAALAVISAVSSGFELKLLNDIEAGIALSPGQAEANDLRQQIIGGVHFVVIVASIVIFCIWIYRANYNARQLGAADMRFSPGWAVGWYFIPIANLWKPYQAMKEIWKASADPAHWQDQPRGSILPVWWTFFLLSNIMSNASFRLSLRANTLPELVAASSVSIANDVLDLISTLTALMLVGQIVRMQMSHRIAAAGH
jgi:hypothetical protein